MMKEFTQNESGNWIRLNLIFPPNLEDAITEALLSDASLPGFTLLQAEGHGNDFSRASISEQVRGRTDRRVLWIVIQHQKLEGLLLKLKTQITSEDIRWWVEPVLAGGKLV